MNRDDRPDTLPQIPEGPEMIEAMRRGVVAAFEEHKRLGVSIVTYDFPTGAIIEVPADSIPIEDESAAWPPANPAP